MYFLPNQNYIDPVEYINTTEAQRAEEERKERFAEQWRAYTGDIEKPLKVRLGDFDDNVILSYPRLTVDTCVSYLFGQGVVFESDSDTEKETPDDKWLNDAWNANGGLSLLMDTSINGGVFGHTFVKIEVPKPGEKFPRLCTLCPEQMTVAWNPRDLREALQFEQVWHGFDPETGKTALYRQTTYKDAMGKWVIVDEVKRANHKWEPLSPPVMWEWDWCPISHCKNLPRPNEFWGTSDIEPDILTMLKAINFNASNINKVIRYYAHPQQYGTGIGSEVEMDRAADSMMVFPNPDARLHLLEMQSQLQAPLEFLSGLKQAYHELTRIPEVATGKLERVGQLSGVAIKILYAPLRSKVVVKQKLYGDLLLEVSRHLLDMGEKGEKPKLTIKFPQVIPLDDLAEAQTLQLHGMLGVSENTIMKKLGYNPAEEETKKEAEEKRDAEREALSKPPEVAPMSAPHPGSTGQTE